MPPKSIDGVTFEEIYETFANSPYGKKLGKEIRYAPYKPPGTTNEKWIEILGPDVNNLEHLLFTLSLTREFIALSLSPHEEWKSRERELGEVKFSQTEQELLCLTAVIHDWGESVVGDIPYNEKNSGHEKIEFEALIKLIGEFCVGRYVSLIPDMTLAANIALKEKETKLSQAFSAIEHVGYGTTSLRAWRSWRNFDGVLSENLYKLATEVTKFHFSLWQRHARIYPWVHHFLLENQPTIDEIMVT